MNVKLGSLCVLWLSLCMAKSHGEELLSSNTWPGGIVTTNHGMKPSSELGDASGFDLPELAHNKPASQSTELWGGKANRAVDGDTSGNWAHSSCTHTAKQQNAWWQVELGAEYSIDRVMVWNREDCCGYMLNQATVMVDDASCGSLGTDRKQTVECSGKKGKVVKIQHSREDYLMLCEVKVYGSASGSAQLTGQAIVASAIDATQAYAAQTVSVQSTTAGAIAQLNRASYTEIDDVFFKKGISDVRQTHAGFFTNVQGPGKCGFDRLAGNPCGSDTWGSKAYKYGCTGESSVPWSDSKARWKIGVHPSMGTFCSNPSSCQVALCKKQDRNEVRHHGEASGLDLSAQLGDDDYSTSIVTYSVNCGVRKKQMVCPMKSGLVTQCAVWKSCGPANSPQHKDAIGGDEFFRRSIWGKTKGTNPTDAQWAAITATAGFKDAMTETCAMQCGFF